jgi:hypothetical protein
MLHLTASPAPGGAIIAATGKTLVVANSRCVDANSMQGGAPLVAWTSATRDSASTAPAIFRAGLQLGTRIPAPLLPYIKRQ